MDRFKGILANKYCLRGIVIVISIIFMCLWVAQKEGYHMDEILAFELSNAEFNPWIVPTQPQGRLAKFMEEHIEADTLKDTIGNMLYIVKDTLQNGGNSILLNYKADVYDAPVWISSETFQDYVRVDAEDDFNLFSVYFNVKDDNHPPVHFMFIHLLSSVFKGEISPWHGCIINMAAMAVCLWLLGKIGDCLQLRESSIIALMVAFGFSTGIVSIALWIRMYGLLTLWIVGVLYMHLKLWNSNGFIRLKKKNGRPKFCSSLPLLMLVLLVFWTQYFGLFFVIPLAAVTVICLWKAKRMPEMWAYVRTMVLAAIVGVLVFPFAISDVLYSGRGKEALAKFGNGIWDFLTRVVEFGQILGDSAVGNIWVLMILLLIPILYFIWRRQKLNIVYAVFLFVPTTVFFAVVSNLSPYFEDRYIMPLFPVILLILIWLWDNVLCKYVADNKILHCIIPMLALVLVFSQGFMRQGTHKYLYAGYNEQVTVAQEYKEYPLVCLYDGYGFYENIVEMECYEQTILVKQQELELMDEQRTAVAEDGYVALIKYPADENGKEQLQSVMDTFGGSQAEIIYAGGCHGDVLYLVLP